MIGVLRFLYCNVSCLYLNFQHLEEAHGPLSREKDELLRDYNNLKVKLDHEYEEQAEKKGKYQQEVVALLTLISKIKQ